MKDETQKLISIENELYTVRLLVMVETSPQSNRFIQILLNNEQFNKFSDQIRGFMPACTDTKHTHLVPCFEVLVDKEHQIKIDHEVRSYYDESDVKRMSGE